MKFLVAAELQKRWVAAPPIGWIAAREQDLLSSEERNMLGYRPIVDLVLTNRSTQHRLWIELEISRADPVANHAKFASAHLLHPISPDDAFVSLVSNHVTRGRANLAAHTTYLLRTSGIRAFQMPLLDSLSGETICKINQGLLPLAQLPTPDLCEVIGLTQPVINDSESDIYYATNSLEVILNVRQWNKDALHDEKKSRWGNRRVKYLVFDKRTGLFAPSKFCAYTRIQRSMTSAEHFNPSMTIEAYSRIPQDHGIFDGQKAWKQISKIGFHKIKATEANSSFREKLAGWTKANSTLVAVDPQQCEILIES